jgi:hypothetical protein
MLLSVVYVSNSSAWFDLLRLLACGVVSRSASSSLLLRQPSTPRSSVALLIVFPLPAYVSDVFTTNARTSCPPPPPPHTHTRNTTRHVHSVGTRDGADRAKFAWGIRASAVGRCVCRHGDGHAAQGKISTRAEAGQGMPSACAPAHFCTHTRSPTISLTHTHSLIHSLYARHSLRSHPLHTHSSAHSLLNHFTHSLAYSRPPPPPPRVGLA